MILKYLIILFFLTWAAYLDIKYRTVPNELIAALLITCLPFLVLEKDIFPRVILFVGFFLFFVISFDWISHIIGGADLKIISVLLLVLPLYYFCITIVLSQVMMIGYAVWRKNLKIKVPYFAFLWVSTATMIMYIYHNVLL